MRLFAGLCMVVILIGCSRNPKITSDVDFAQLTKDKSQVPPDSHEAISSTYFELTAWTGDDSKNPPNAISAIGTLGSKSQIGCISASEKSGAQNGGQCEVTIPAGTFKLKVRQTVTSTGSGAVRLSCAGETPAVCKAVVVN